MDVTIPGAARGTQPPGPIRTASPSRAHAALVLMTHLTDADAVVQALGLVFSSHQLGSGDPNPVLRTPKPVRGQPPPRQIRDPARGAGTRHATCYPPTETAAPPTPGGARTLADGRTVATA